MKKFATFSSLIYNSNNWNSDNNGNKQVMLRFTQIEPLILSIHDDKGIKVKNTKHNIAKICAIATFYNILTDRIILVVEKEFDINLTSIPKARRALSGSRLINISALNKEDEYTETKVLWNIDTKLINSGCNNGKEIKVIKGNDEKESKDENKDSKEIKMNNEDDKNNNDKIYCITSIDINNSAIAKLVEQSPEMINTSVECELIIKFLKK